MKSKVIKTNRPKKILQVFINQNRYSQDQKSFEHRKEANTWGNKIPSLTGYTPNGNLTMPEYFRSPDLNHCDVIVLTDFNNNSTQRSTGTPIQYFSLTGSSKRYEIFQMRQEADLIELHLMYSLFEIGLPKRENYKLFELKMDTPVEVKINGKLDYTLSSRADRTFLESSYIFHLIGETDTFELYKPNLASLTKEIPKPLKIVDLLKTLY